MLGVNDRAQLAAIERIVQARAADALMRAGTSLADPSRIDVRGVLNCGRDVRIDVGCVFEGTVELADDVAIGAYCVMKNVTVGAGTEIAPFSHLDNAIIGARCRVGPYSRLRPGATLAEDVHIGNFVEVKASTLGRGSKANHLAYVGDTTVGAAREHRCRVHHRELRRRQQASDRDRGRCVDRIELRAGGAGQSGQGRDDRRRQHDHQGRPGRRTHGGKGGAGRRSGLEATGEEAER